MVELFFDAHKKVSVNSLCYYLLTLPPATSIPLFEVSPSILSNTMPRLGSDDLAPPRREAAAYAGHRSNPMQLSTIVMVLVFTFIVRNIFFTVSV
jgi:hypothetical protein